MNVEFATVSQIDKEGFRFGFYIQRYAPKAHTGAAPKYESFATVGEIRVYRRADFQSGSRVLKKVF